MFPGYLSARAFPVHVILITTSVSLFILSVDAVRFIGVHFSYVENHPQRIQAFFAAAWYFWGMRLFRVNLRDANENALLSLARLWSKISGIKLVSNVEYELYRIRLEIAELHRLKFDLSEIKKFALFVEDRSFYDHRGISLRGMSRAVYGLLSGKRRGGGSTITQQLVRAQFIIKPNDTFRRKILEIILALWVERCLSKKEIMEGYLGTARFENGIYGFHRAYRHFFFDSPKVVEKWEAFILIERLGNIHSRFLGKRVKQLLGNAIEKEIMSIEDAISCLDYYSSFLGHHFMVSQGEISPRDVKAAIIGKA
jgi:penicillin-binding protein 1A